MSLTIEEVKHVAMLARIGLTDEEIETLQREFDIIFKHIDTLAELDLEGVEPTSRPLPVLNITRADEIVEPLGIEKALKNAPAREGSAFQVPRIVAAGGDA
ncbi:MAG: Asp-tRNA(Asn)/Glu-tRNA(Gln) amidotransferase subunit GatC [Coriobacteriia bacterium]|nr:Asp-tRNA(Asn)/Glu-tRNA(Gln) amidotransferase subunit GatC [Coriobacteriia bacterium]